MNFNQTQYAAGSTTQSTLPTGELSEKYVLQIVTTICDNAELCNTNHL
jgi:hypothetical protein